MASPRRGKSKGPGFRDLVDQDLKTKNYRPVYLMVGEDTHRMEQVIAHIRKGALGQGAGDFNNHVLHGDQVPVGKILQQALSLPMFGGRQVIWVKQAAACLEKQDGQAALEKYLQKPVPETILIMTCEKIDKRRKWVKICQESGYLFDFTPPSGEALIQWVLKAARKENLPLQREQAALLCELVGNDLMSLKSEIDKLALLSEDSGKLISTEELGKIIMDQAALDGYEITAGLRPGGTAEVLNTWFRLAEWGRTAYEVAPLVLGRVRMAALLDACRRNGITERQLAALTGSSPYSFKYLNPMIEGRDPEKIRDGLLMALACDKALKSSPLKPALVFEKLIMDLCRKD